jgi:hypothetical protein
MAEAEGFFGSLQVTPFQINAFMGTMFWIIMGIFILGLFAYILYKTKQRMEHTISATIYTQIGNAEVKDEDWAKKVYTGEGRYLFHYLNLNKNSPLILDKYMKIVKKKRFGIFSYSVKGFDAFLKDGKIIPMDLNKRYNEDGTITDVALTGHDYDAFNFMQSELEAFLIKKQKIDKLLALAPYGALLLIIIAFIVGQTLYTKHLETMSQIWLNSAKASIDSIVNQIGNLQVIPPG